MNRSPYSFIGISALLLVVLLVTHARVFDAVMYFLFAGIIPGTNYALSPLAMFLLILAITWLVCMHISAVFATERKLSQEAHKILERTQRMPRRRYQRS